MSRKTNQLRLIDMENIYTTKLGKIWEKYEDLSGNLLHLSREKFMSNYIWGMISSRSVEMNKIASHMPTGADKASNIRSIQRFYKQVLLDYSAFWQLMMGFFWGKSYYLCIDRTNWISRGQNVNILCLTIHYEGLALPLMFELLDKQGNSSCDERIDLLGQFIDLFGTEHLLGVIGDREFVGEKWITYLQKLDIKFHLRIRKNMNLGIENETLQGEEFLAKQGQGFHQNIQVGSHSLHLACKYIKKTSPKKTKKQQKNQEEEDFLLILTNDSESNPFEIYKKRWSIETFFQAIKKRGFDIESTHLTDLSKLKKLFLMASIAYLICTTVGILAHKHDKPIKRDKNNYLRKSFTRYGMDILQNALKIIDKSTAIIDSILTRLWLQLQI